MDHFYEGLVGWFDYQDIYSRMVTEANQKAHFVEIGVFYGRSAAYMIVEIANSGKDIRFDCIDPDDRFIRNLLSVADRYNPIVQASPTAADLYEDGSLDFVWIDGDHSEEAVRADINAWLPKVRNGGWLGGHDYDNVICPGVRVACMDLLSDHVEIPPTGGAGSSSWLWRKP